jgi:protein KRI1
MGEGEGAEGVGHPLGSDSDGGGKDLSKININEEYAHRFEHNKRRELLQRHEECKKRDH